MNPPLIATWQKNVPAEGEDEILKPYMGTINPTGTAEDPRQTSLESDNEQVYEIFEMGQNPAKGGHKGRLLESKP